MRLIAPPVDLFNNDVTCSKRNTLTADDYGYLRFCFKLFVECYNYYLHRKVLKC